MRILLTTIAVYCCFIIASAQENTLPTSGNIGGRAENPSTDQSNSTINENTYKSERVEVPGMILYPNPTHSQLSIVLENEYQNENFDFFIYNFSGTLVHGGSSNERTKIDLNLASGMYLVKVKTEQTWYTEKLSIK